MRFGRRPRRSPRRLTKNPWNFFTPRAATRPPARASHALPMNKLWQQLAIATNWPVIAATAVLTSLGVMSIWADSPADGHKQLVFLFVGLLAMAAFQAFDYRLIGRFSWGLYVLSLMLILYTVLGNKMS